MNLSHEDEEAAALRAAENRAFARDAVAKRRAGQVRQAAMADSRAFDAAVTYLREFTNFSQDECIDIVVGLLATYLSVASVGVPRG
jgi:hypothetical protein